MTNRDVIVTATILMCFGESSNFSALERIMRAAKKQP